VSGSHGVVRWFRSAAQQLPKLVQLSSARGIWCGLGGPSVRSAVDPHRPTALAHTRTQHVRCTHTACACRICFLCQLPLWFYIYTHPRVSASATRALASWSRSWWIREAGGQRARWRCCTHRVRTTLSTLVAKDISRRRGRGCRNRACQVRS
jgi:hypothetical protein